MRKFPSLLLTSALLAALASPVFADDWRRHEDIHHFHEHDYARWRAGRWFHGFHEGHDGWWWVVEGSWYFYPTPVYPYPDPYVPPMMVVAPAPVAPVRPHSFYYCVNPAGYYPYVPQCYQPWQKVSAKAAIVVAQASPPPPVVVQVPPPAPAPAPVPVPLPAPTPPPGTLVLDNTPRVSDEWQYNTYVTALQNISPGDKNARAKFKDLEKQIEKFRQSLYQRNYNAMDILKNTEDLERRLAEQKERLAKHEKAAAKLPRGSTVIFPEQ